MEDGSGGRGREGGERSRESGRRNVEGEGGGRVMGGREGGRETKNM